MLRFFYDLFLLGSVVATLPYFLWQMVFRRKYRRSIKHKFGIGLPRLASHHQKVIWVHSVSVGETLAVIPLLKLFNKENPDVAIVFSTTTETGQEFARKNLSFVEAFFYLPLDFSWNIEKVLRRYKPSLLILVESDFWYNLLTGAKEKGVHTLVVNGKISERSLKRFLKVSFFSKPLFSAIDRVCVQTEEYKKRFSHLLDPQKIVVTGNIKLDFGHQEFALNEKVKQLLSSADVSKLIVLGSTHEVEEELLLSSLRPLILSGDVLVALVPRHIERCARIENLLRALELEYSIFSQKDAMKAPVVLVDALGVLKSFYYYAKIAFVGGTFAEQVGGHNLFEPLYFKKPVVYGPYTFSQKEMDELILAAKCGIKVFSADEFIKDVSTLLHDEEVYQQMSNHAEVLTASLRGSVGRTLDQIHHYIHKK